MPFLIRYKKFTAASCLLLFLGLLTIVLEYCKPKDNSLAEAGAATLTYQGDQACRSCHEAEHSKWLESDHYMAMQPATDSTVKGDFNDVVLEADGVTSRFYRNGDKFMIRTEGPGGKPTDYEVKYTFGHFPLQQYLVAFPGGRMQVPRVSWDSRDKRWFHQYAGQKIHHRDWLHWSRGSQNWNTMCASCHSTNLVKNYLPEADSFHTSWSVLNVSCESCHGPGSRHIEKARSGDYHKGDHGLQQPDYTSNLQMANACAPCHARKADISPELLHSTEIMDNLIPEIPQTEFFHADGQVDDEDYIYTSFLQSKMFHRSVKCTNCHEPHSGKLVMPVGQLCLQCHEPKYATAEHHHHPAEAMDLTCVSCHMPGKNFMGNDYRHDHSFRVPRPDLTVKAGVPNACNDCHKKQTAGWAADAVRKWYGPERKYHFSDDLIPGSAGGPGAEPHLLRLLGDTSVPAIVKATAANYLGNHPTDEGLRALLLCLKHNDAQVRYRALRSLSSFPMPNWRESVFPMFTDKVRAVRIAAADLFTGAGANDIPASFQQAWISASKELESYIHYQADFAVGNVMIADYYMRQRNVSMAERYYQRGLQKDSMMNYARLNLSSLYNTTGNNQMALKVLLEALATDPKNERVHYNLALLYSELAASDKADHHFKEVIRLGSVNPRVYYNYGISLQQRGKFSEAEAILKKGLKADARDPSLNYAIAYLYIQRKEPGKALPFAQVLKSVDPNNPEYSALFQILKL